MNPAMTLAEAYNEFVLDRQSMRARPTTMRYYNWIMPHFFAWLNEQGVTLIGEVAARHIRAYFVEKQTAYKGTPDEREASGHYVHGIARAIRAFIRFCADNDFITSNPMRAVKMPRRPKKVLQAFSADEIQRLVNACDNDRDRALVHFLLDTGVRAAECIGVQIGDVDRNEKSVLIRHGKGDKERVVYYGVTTEHYLHCHLALLEDATNDYPLWYNLLRGKPLTRSGLFQFVRRLGKAAGVSTCTCHTFRRTFALNCLRNGMDIYMLAGLMGHSDITVLRQYLAITRDDLQEAHRRYSPVDNFAPRWALPNATHQVNTQPA